MGSSSANSRGISQQDVLPRPIVGEGIEAEEGVLLSKTNPTLGDYSNTLFRK